MSEGDTELFGLDTVFARVEKGNLVSPCRGALFLESFNGKVPTLRLLPPVDGRMLFRITSPCVVRRKTAASGPALSLFLLSGGINLYAYDEGEIESIGTELDALPRRIRRIVI